ncbi:translation initiation factor IF-1 [uncultured Paludibaculum sp.]|uniref:translation initiation factor IF-1 n=1 Tax=uncultured Paludibaculum sp. TaxID=1765020 RepID=UPI002AAA7EC5|nr:translation initiation factor IF-1 [uncultured Paludibaculum sp.]
MKSDRGPGASGEVVEILPASTFLVELADRRRVVAHLAAAVQRGFVRLRLRDRVEVELTAADPNRGRIVKVLKND